MNASRSFPRVASGGSRVVAHLTEGSADRLHLADAVRLALACHWVRAGLLCQGDQHAEFFGAAP